MDATLIVDEAVTLSARLGAEIVIWRLPRQLPGSRHVFKYRLALIEDDVCVLRFDNEAGKGDHRHVGRHELAYDFVDVETLMVDFWTEVDTWQKSR